jgi:quercetin dioxygenase-like cupin family protein
MGRHGAANGAAYEDLDPELLDRLCDLIAPAAPPPRALQRLMHTIEALPLRYAPFFEQLAELWDLPEADVVALLERAEDPRIWRKVPLFPVRLIEVMGGPKTHGAETLLVRFEASGTVPRHRHPGPETLLVLEGMYEDSLGRVVRAGDLHQMAPGTEHAVFIGKQGPCVAATLQWGREFTGPIMRIVSQIVDR